MKGQFEVGGQNVRVDFTRGTCIAIPLDFEGPQPSHFDAAPAQVQPMRAGTFVGDVRLGGTCNVPIVSLNPHCNGTHTESVGHIVRECVPVHAVVPPGPQPATLITVAPQPAIICSEDYQLQFEPDDQVLTAANLAEKLADVPPQWLACLVLRTSPNGEQKKARRWGASGTPPFFTHAAIDLLVRSGVRHLLVDLPSVDRTHDDGWLSVHHRFWNVAAGAHRLTEATHTDRTITEMIYVPDLFADGRYFLTIEVPAFEIDAAPSRPWLFPVELL